MAKAQATNEAAARSKTPDNEASFPIRCAAIDIGSNAMRFLAAEVSESRKVKSLYSKRVPVRLGHEVFLSGRLSQKAMDDGILALTEFRSAMEERQITLYRAVATSAVRESKNGNLFVERAQKEAGIALEAITGSEEARLVHLAVKHRMNLGGDRWILADLGGGSVEVSLVDDSGILWSESHTMGSVRLLEELSGHAEEPGRFLRLLEEYTATLRIPSTLSGAPIAGYAATGGNIESLASLAGCTPGPRGVEILPLDGLRTLIDRLARLSYRQRVDELRLREDRADVILPAAMVYERLGIMVGVREIHVPRVGIKDGLLLDLADRILPPPGLADHLEHQAQQSALSLGRRYFFDEEHGKHVAKLSLSIFDQARSLHKLNGADRRILMVAAMIHDIGSFISRKSHHKHTHYLVSNSELLGFSPREIQLVANVARYHRKGPPRTEHVPFNRLTKSERERSLKLASILRLADALDREHLQNVTGVEATLRSGTFFLRLEGEADYLLEGWALRKKADLFEKTFQVKVRLSNGG